MNEDQFDTDRVSTCKTTTSSITKKIIKKRKPRAGTENMDKLEQKKVKLAILDSKHAEKSIAPKERIERTKLRQNLTARDRRIRIKNESDLCMKTISVIVKMLLDTWSCPNKDNASKDAALKIMKTFKKSCEEENLN